MGGGYIICEWADVQREYPEFQATFAALENKMIQKCNMDWSPKTFGYMAPRSDQYGRTTILPELFDGFDTNRMSHWRQTITSVGHQTIVSGTQTGNTIQEDMKVAWLGLALPNKQQHLTEIKWQIGDRKFGRINIEEVNCYKTPAIIFEDGYIIDGETSFELYGYLTGPVPAIAWPPETDAIYQSFVMLGASYYRVIDKVLGSTGAAIT